MSIKRILPIGVMLAILVSAGVFALWSWGPTALQAQDDTTPTDLPQIFLPLIFAPSDASSQIDDLPTTPTTGGTGSLTEGHDHDHAVPPLGSWPPQPVGITAVNWLTNTSTAMVIAAQSQMETAESIALASPLVQAALGDTYIHATTIQPHAKAALTAAGKDAESIRIAYFSYTNNTTVEATVAAGKVTSVQSVMAATYQPEPTRQERLHAIEVARDYFLAEGETRVNQLHGFVIMAYRPQGATGFYESRVLYVTFHESLDERPEYLAWVDLSHETILKAVVDTFEQHVPANTTNRQAGEGQ